MNELPIIKGEVKLEVDAEIIVIDPVQVLPDPEPVQEVIEPTLEEKLHHLTRAKAWAAGEESLRAKGLSPEHYNIDAVEKDGEWTITYRSRTQLDKEGSVIL